MALFQNYDVLERVFNGVDPRWQELLRPGIGDVKINDCIYPREELIMEAFRQCPWPPRVVLIGQDPYPNDKASGLSFSTRDGSLTPSLKNILACLRAHGFVKTDGNLTNWAHQGVLLLNRALTRGVVSAQLSAWKKYTNTLISALSDRVETIVFILLGAAAQELTSHIDELKHYICAWGHPSPAATGNNFIECDAFTRANAQLIDWDHAPIQWGYAQPPPPHNVNAQLRDISLFTDGGATGNGRAHCRASYAWMLMRGEQSVQNAGTVVPIDIPGKVYKTSNQRAELLALLRGLEALIQHYEEGIVHVYSDSLYSIKCVREWYPKWTRENDYTDKLNLDILHDLARVYSVAQKKYNIELVHVRSHQEIPADPHSLFIWRGNDAVDKLCTRELERVIHQ